MRIPKKDSTYRALHPAAIICATALLCLVSACARPNPDEMVVRARGFVNEGLYDDAIKLCNEQLEKFPDCAGLYLARGHAYYQKNETALAAADFEKAVELDPNDPEAHHCCGVVHFKDGLVDQAIQDYTNAIELSSGFCDAYFNRGNALAYAGRFDEAISDYDAAIEINPRHVQAYCNRGLAWLQKRDFEKAIDDFQRALEIVPEYEMAKNLLEQAEEMRDS